MVLEFGRVETFTPKGFGFVSSVFHGEIFFHIKTVKEQRIKNVLEENKDVKHIETDLFFWYLLEEKEKKFAVSHIYKSLSEVPDELVTQFSEKFVEDIEFEHFSKFSGKTLLNFCKDLFIDKRTSPLRHDEFTSTDLFISTPTIAFLFMGTKGLNKVLKNQNHKVEDLTNKYRVIQRRDISATERKLISKFKENTRGLSQSSPKLFFICLKCESNNVVLVGPCNDRGGGPRQCEECESEWYSNFCWNCGSGVDSRDTLIKKCETCRWYICSDCGSCKDICEKVSS